MDLRNITIGELLKERCESTPKELAIEFHERKYTWEEVYDISLRFSSYFLSLGIRSGEGVLIMGPNTPNWIFCFLGLQNIGAIAIPVNQNFHEKELKCVLKLTKAKRIVFDDKKNILEIVNNVKKDKDYIDINPMNFDYSKFERANFDFNNPDKVACILMTSGTTGVPKGAQLTHNNLVNNGGQIAKSLNWNSEDSMVVTVPLFHSFGITACLIAAITKGFSLYINEHFSSKDILKLIEEKRITIMNGVPSMFLFLINHNDLDKYDLSSLNSGIIAGSPLNEKEYLNIAGKLKMNHLLQSYGQTETSPCITMSEYSLDVKCISKNVGKVIEHCEVRIVDNCNNKLDFGSIGSIEVRGFNVMKGYIGDKKTYSNQDWLPTNDLGYLDEDGNLYIVGRERDIIIRGGENILALEIESIAKELDFIQEARAIAIPDKIMNEEIGLCVSFKGEGSVEEILNYFEKSVSKHKIPKYLKVVDELPKNTCGKIDDKKVFEIFKEEI